MIGMLLMICLAVASVVTTQRPSATNWKPLEFFVGSWDGQETGTEGIGTGRGTYEFELGGRYLVGKNRSVFPPQDRKPKGEGHEDWEIFSYDEGRKLYVLRQFHIEGFVVQLQVAAGNPSRPSGFSNFIRWFITNPLNDAANCESSSDLSRHWK